MSDTVWALHMQGYSVPSIAAQTGLSEYKVRREIVWHWATDKGQA